MTLKLSTYCNGEHQAVVQAIIGSSQQSITFVSHVNSSSKKLFTRPLEPLVLAGTATCTVGVVDLITLGLIVVELGCCCPMDEADTTLPGTTGLGRTTLSPLSGALSTTSLAGEGQRPGAADTKRRCDSMSPCKA
eukprot:CAMPEP_0170196918 /NCGR_PEP_ID=MMETSP0040_2-20121228/65163_1 /TAXON_ID=641309 /ORGANISM="Lotharella oceanica, Strain CCMP622" /LENGTH=134 /DNA_ID=CAMNT_0010446489 /DNA_START=540 /DNA_END=940 /DNA_ORIENTATION=-